MQEPLVGSSDAMGGLLDTLRRLAVRGDTTVLILGESGTGKNLLAKALHEASPRGDGPFLTITCTALPEALLESELFGHEKGAFTDAADAKPGLLETAHTGTVFLDEIGDLPASTQAKLLRFLESRRFRRLGGTHEIEVDVRVVAATHRDLAALVRSGHFREDLYYRLLVLPLRVPPLRERPEDIPELARHFLQVLGPALRGAEAPRDISPGAMDVLCRHGWPGNVRELRNCLERALVLARSRIIEQEDIQLNPAGGLGRPAGDHGDPFRLPAEGLDLEALERGLLIQALERSGGNRTRAGRLLGLSRDQIRYRIEKYGL